MPSKKITDLPQSDAEQLKNTDCFEISTENANRLRQSKKTRLLDMSDFIYQKQKFSNSFDTRELTIKQQIEQAANQNEFETIILTETTADGKLHKYRLFVKNGNLVIDDESNYEFGEEMLNYMASITKGNQTPYNYILIYNEAIQNQPSGITRSDIEKMKADGDRLKLYAYGDASHTVLPVSRRSEWDDTKAEFEPLFLKIRYALNQDEPYQIVITKKESNNRTFNSYKSFLEGHTGVPRIDNPLYESVRHDLYEVYMITYGNKLANKLDQATTLYEAEQTPNNFKRLKEASDAFYEYTVSNLDKIYKHLIDDGTGTSTQLGHNSYKVFYDENKDNEDEEIAGLLITFNSDLNTIIFDLKDYLPECESESIIVQTKCEEAVKLIERVRSQYVTIKNKIDRS